MNQLWSKAVLIGASLVVLACVVVILYRPREPVYRGKPLSYWFDQLQGTNSNCAGLAIIRMGSNAIPFLLQTARHNDPASPSRKLYRSAFVKLPRCIQQQLPAPQVPDNYFSHQVASALSMVGRSAMPVLLAALEDHSPLVRLAVVQAVAEMSLDRKVAPILARRLSDPNGDVELASARILLNQLDEPTSSIGISQDLGATIVLAGSQFGIIKTNLGPSAKVPPRALIRLLGHSKGGVRAEAGVALWRIHHQTNGLPAVIEELEQTTDGATCRRMLLVLAEMGPWGKAAQSTVVRTLNEPKWKDVSGVARRVLLRMDAEAK